MIHCSLDHISISCQSSVSILAAARIIGVTIPRFCYHELLTVAGNCRMCLVELDPLEKPIAACATEIKSDMDILVNSVFVQKARENVLETLLLNHPLDCPICDQAGECDLQDQAKRYGLNHSRYFLDKNTTEDKKFNPLIKALMTRCIACTRCVRFSSEIAGIDYFGTLNRGRNTEIGTYSSNILQSEISANVVDLCPVGALNSNVYSNSGRPWELRTMESIDLNDSLGSNLFINCKENLISRILPKVNKFINDSIITDNARQLFDHVYRKRISRNYENINGTLTDLTVNISDKIVYPKKFTFFFDQKLSLKAAVFLKQLNYFLRDAKINNRMVDNVENNSNFFTTQTRPLYQLLQLTPNSQNFLILGSSLEKENSIINSKIRFLYRFSKARTNYIGFNYNTNNFSNQLSLKLIKLIEILEGNLKCFEYRNFFKNTTLISGESFISKFSNKINFLNLLKKYSSEIHNVLIGLKSNSEGLNYLNFKNITRNILDDNQSYVHLNAEDNIYTRKLFDFTLNSVEKSNERINSQQIWANTNGSAIALKSQLILPLSTNFEDENSYINVEHRPQTTSNCVTVYSTNKVTPIISAINNIFSTNFIAEEAMRSNYLNYCDELIYYPEKYQEQNIDKNNYLLDKTCESNDFFSIINKTPLKQKIKNVYTTNLYNKNSDILQSCSQIYQLSYKNLIY